MKRYLLEAAKHCKRYALNWDSYVLASDSYLAGFHSRGANSHDEIATEPLEDGEHQLSARTFRKWKEENANLPFKELLSTYLPMIKFDDVRITEDKNGVISFQGTATRVKPAESGHYE